jgi:hypothetical protein
LALLPNKKPPLELKRAAQEQAFDLEVERQRTYCERELTTASYRQLMETPYKHECIFRTTGTYCECNECNENPSPVPEWTPHSVERCG